MIDFSKVKAADVLRSDFLNEYHEGMRFWHLQLAP